MSTRTRRAETEVAALAERQWGVLTRVQLERLGVSGARLSRWADTGRLHRLHPGVYAIGHRALAVKGRLAAALLYGGPGAVLSHTTAAWWWELRGDEPRLLHVSVPIRRRSVPGVVVHGRRSNRRVVRGGLPVTTVARTLLDLATVVPPAALRRTLAEAEYRGLIAVEAVKEEGGRGVRGSAALRAAVARHCPELALTRSVLEDRFLALCEDHGLPLPRVNARVCGLTVDALWEREQVVVELDGHAAHATPTAVERDRRRELRLRAAGHLVLRYTWGQVTDQARLVAADLRAALGPR